MREPASRRRPPPAVTATVVALDDAGRGVVHENGRRLVVDGALVGERIVCRPRRGRRQSHRAELMEVLEASTTRGEPVCEHFGVCGGCRLQHMPGGEQVAWKQRTLARAFAEQAGVEPEAYLDPLTGPTRGYRRHARLGVKYVPGKGGTLVGYREKHGGKLAELAICATLEPRVGREIANIRRMIDRLEIRHRIPQLEVAMGDTGTALVLRHLEALSPVDRGVLREFAVSRDWQLYLQPGGPDSVRPLWPDEPSPLRYALPDFDLEFEFLPLDFIQVNAAMNRLVVREAARHLDLRADSRVLDLFCGIGNFTLAMARGAAYVTGIEGDAGLVSRALGNARRNRIDNVRFVGADLGRADVFWDWRREGWDRLLLDPPRSGAAQVLAALQAPLPQRIVYVSCNPHTLATDTALLVHGKGYHLLHAGVVDMFPHTAHCEAMAVFELG